MHGWMFHETGQMTVPQLLGKGVLQVMLVQLSIQC